jgi:hypothetical protein
MVGQGGVPGFYPRRPLGFAPTGGPERVIFRCVSGPDPRDGAPGAQSPRGWHSYLCGAPELVDQLRRRIFLAGARMDAICADAFLPTAPAKT